MSDRLSSGGFPPIYLQAAGSSFTDLLRASAPDLLPGRRALPQGMTGAGDLAPHGTTIVAATYDGGVVLAGDRRATMGNVIASRDIEKVFAADAWSAVGIAGTAGIAIEMVRLFQVELEHYEKIEGATLSLDGKANRLSLMIRGNLSIAMQGLAVVPLYVGWDQLGTDPAQAGRIFSYDVTGGCYEERYFHSIGSGSTFARSALKKLWHQDMTREEVVRAIIESLYDAADDDSATGGPDPTRGLFPTAYVIDAEGSRRLDDELIESTSRDVIAERTATFRPHAVAPHGAQTTGTQTTGAQAPGAQAPGGQS